MEDIIDLLYNLTFDDLESYEENREEIIGVLEND